MIAIEELHTLFLRSSGVTTDSRNTPLNSLFFALKGETFDGNLFAKQAIKNGCLAAIVDCPEQANNEYIILVENTLETLQALARFHRRYHNIPIIAITGTNGKTTTKELTASVLKQHYNILYTQGNLNNHIGVPLTLLRLKPEHQIGLIEMGANHPGEIKTLVEIAEPNYGLITNVGKAHLEGFGGFEGVIRTKCEMYDYIRTTGGTVFLHSDNPILEDNSQGLEKITYGESKGNFLHGHLDSSKLFLTFHYTCQNDIVHHIQTQLIGNYNLMNAMAAATIGHYLGVSAEKVNRGIEQYTPENKRSQWSETQTNRLIIDAYNANPSSMRVAIENFKEIKTQLPKILILGDMRELGDESFIEHKEIVLLVQQLGFTKVFTSGTEFKNVAPLDFFAFNNTLELIDYLSKNPITHSCLLIKGSRGLKLEQLLPLL